MSIGLATPGPLRLIYVHPRLDAYGAWLSYDDSEDHVEAARAVETSRVLSVDSVSYTMML